ncbi:hypothetical protein ONE63_004798 [Megalurothrips usitatus]|uniref:AB hydrolase-1 domain-containing protein n=1 Tax=Megalurothrips usitatus TaxID=439358 RepID=A0AAV7X7A1_9NEOP|nr:hypothetical protein ONE63_004798 [Megalurothrips usitatus]
MEAAQIMTTTVSEVTLPVPWGHISGKVWGSLSAPPVLCVHGIQDNANTFDNLIPLMPSSFCYVAIDLPGHGRSSHFPSGFVFSNIDYVMSVRRIVDHFEWKRFIYMGHSLGGQIGFFFSGFYPEHVSKLIVLDSVLPYRDPRLNLSECVTKFYDNLFILEKKMASQEPPSYSEGEALRRLTDGRPSTLTREAAMLLFSRGVTKVGEGYAFSADQRLKYRALTYLSKEETLGIISRIRCPVFLIRASETEDAGSYYVNGDFEKLLQATLGAQYHYKVVRGSHDVHLNNPEDFAEELSNFVIKQQSSL